MIKARFKTCGGQIVSLEISGHADSAPHGEDLVCALVSGVAFGLCNAVNELCGIEDIEIGDNVVRIRIDKPTTVSEAVMRTGLIQLQTAAEQSKYLKIKVTEV